MSHPPHLGFIDNQLNFQQDEGQIKTPNDTYFSSQWALDDSSPFSNGEGKDVDINWLEGQKAYENDLIGGSEEGPSVVVAVIDSGVDYNHPDLKDAMWTNPEEIAGNGIDDDDNGIVDDMHGANFVRSSRCCNPPPNDPLDTDINTMGFGHGTAVAGIVVASANNGEGIAGVAGNSKGKVKIMAIRYLGPNGGEFSWLLKSVNYAFAKKAQISNNSYGSRSRGNREWNEVFESILRNQPEHLFITAAGNSNQTVTREDFPGGMSLSNHVNVASSTDLDERDKFSNYGKPNVHVFAPGEKIATTFPLRNYRYQSGTSFAAPQVAGLAALLMSMREGLSPEEVKILIEQNVQRKPQYEDLVTSGGLIDVNATISSLISEKPLSCLPGWYFSSKKYIAHNSIIFFTTIL